MREPPNEIGDVVKWSVFVNRHQEEIAALGAACADE